LQIVSIIHSPTCFTALFCCQFPLVRAAGSNCQAQRFTAQNRAKISGGSESPASGVKAPADGHKTAGNVTKSLVHQRPLPRSRIASTGRLTIAQAIFSRIVSRLSPLMVPTHSKSQRRYCGRG